MSTEQLAILAIGVTTLLVVYCLRGRLRKFFVKIGLFEMSLETRLASEKVTHNGGRGGNASVIGDGGTAIGGKGGAGGPGGKGGDGGHAEAQGENAFAMGGEGGEAGQANRGGKGGRGPLHVLMEDSPEKWKEISGRFGLTEEEAKKYGKGGHGGMWSV